MATPPVRLKARPGLLEGGWEHSHGPAEGPGQVRLLCSLQRHGEELVPRLAADLLGEHAEQHLRIFKLIQDFLQPAVGQHSHIKGNPGPRGHGKQNQPHEFLQRLDHTEEGAAMQPAALRELSGLITSAILRHQSANPTYR